MDTSTTLQQRLAEERQRLVESRGLSAANENDVDHEVEDIEDNDTTMTAAGAPVSDWPLARFGIQRPPDDLVPDEKVAVSQATYGTLVLILSNLFVRPNSLTSTLYANKDSPSMRPSKQTRPSETPPSSPSS
jgi:hypothetical protein